MQDLLTLIGFVVLYIVMMRWVLPKLGVRA
jgi:hypothetical protein